MQRLTIFLLLLFPTVLLAQNSLNVSVSNGIEATTGDIRQPTQEEIDLANSLQIKMGNGNEKDIPNVLALQLFVQSALSAFRDPQRRLNWVDGYRLSDDDERNLRNILTDYTVSYADLEDRRLQQSCFIYYGGNTEIEESDREDIAYAILIGDLDGGAELYQSTIDLIATTVSEDMGGIFVNGASTINTNSSVSVLDSQKFNAHHGITTQSFFNQKCN